MKKYAVALALTALCAVSVNPLLAGNEQSTGSGNTVQAQAPEQKIDPARLQAARKLIHITTSDQLVDQVLGMAINQVGAVLVRKKPEKEKELTEIMHRLANEMKTSPRRQELIEKIARIYARQFTADEMNRLIAFFQTPAGQKFIRKMPLIVAESQKAALQWGQQMARDLFLRAREEARKKGIDL